MKSSASLILAAVATGVLSLAGVALALPSEVPEDSPMVNGPVRAIEQVGQNVWVGGNFTQVQHRNGALVDNVRNLAVFDSATGAYKDIAPIFGVAGSPVRDIEVYGSDVVVAGNFGGPTSTQKNLVVLDGATGRVVQWYNAPALQSVLAAPGLGRIYGGGVSLSAFEVSSTPTHTVSPLWKDRAKTTVDTTLRSHNTGAGYRDLELDGSTIWAACACDAIAGQPAKALAKLNTDGVHQASWVAKDYGVAAFGISVADANGALYLAAGGDDFLAQYSKSDGSGAWVRDTSGSTQAVEVMDEGLVIGGHFWEVADQEGDRCGFRSSNNAATLEPYGDECQTRHGLAAYSFSGTLDPGWSPMIEGQYNLAWALQPDEIDPQRLHFGGEFLTVNGVKQTYYARLSESGSADVTAPVVQMPTHYLTAAGSTLGASTVPVKVSWSAADDRGPVARYELQQSTDGGASYTNVGLSTPTTTTKTLPLAPGGGYRFRARATDDAGNVSAWAEGQPFAVDASQQETAGVLAYSGGWAEQSLSTAFGGSTTHSSEVGATATLTFEGTDVSWAAQRGPDRGRAEVRLDGRLVETVDLYTASAQPRRVAYNASSLDPSVEHTLEVRVLGTKRAASSGTRVDVDAFLALR